MVTADQFLCHAIGDYVLQSHWMATEKTKSWLVALIHAAAYSLPFVLLTRSLPALAVILLTHAAIDRLRLAVYVVRVKNVFLGRFGERWATYQTPLGMPADVPPFLSVWLFIIVDNVLHVLINGAALKWL